MPPPNSPRRKPGNRRSKLRPTGVETSITQVRKSGPKASRRAWTSPGGRTPEAAPYSAILRELATKGDKARFQKVDRGRFAYRAGA
jgi:hypothetical protein